MTNLQLIKQRSPELLLQELKDELKARVSEYLNIVKDIRSDDRENLRARCALFAYEDILTLLTAMENEEYVDVEPNYFAELDND